MPLTARAEAKPETNGNALGESSSARGDAKPLSSRSQPQQQSARGSSDDAKVLTGRQDAPTITARVAAMDTSRDYMSTARMHTALSALTAERAELLNKLAFIDSTLEAEGKKKLMRTRGFMAPMNPKGSK